MIKTLIKNFIYAFGAQCISLLASVMVIFIIPSLIGVEEFAYWQLFLTYVTYVNITRLGLVDGLYLRLGGKHYEELDYNLLSNERRVFIIFQTIVAIGILVAILTMKLQGDRTFVLISCCVCIVIINANNFLGYILRAVNLTRIHSISIMLQNFAWIIAVLITLLVKIYSYKILIVMYIIGHICAGIYLMLHTKEIVKHRTVEINIVLSEIKEDIACGIKLMIAAYAGNLILGSARIIIDSSWGIETFGYFAFSLTLANVFLTFINQVSIVLFPALRRVKATKQKDVYYLVRNILSLVLPAVMLGYFPIMIIVHLVLPQYEQSLLYLPIFLPICTFDGKMQMMCSTFFQSMRKETTLMIINLAALSISILMTLIGVFVVQDIFFIAYGLLVTIALRSIVSEVILAKLIGANIFVELFQELGLVVIFLVLTNIFAARKVFIIFGIIYIIYLVINKKRVSNIVQMRKHIR